MTEPFALDFDDAFGIQPTKAGAPTPGATSTGGTAPTVSPPKDTRPAAFNSAFNSAFGHIPLGEIVIDPSAGQGAIGTHPYADITEHVPWR